MLSRKRPYWYEVDDPRPGDKIFGKDITPDIAVGTSRVPLQPPFEDNKLYLIIKDPLHPIDTVQEAVKHDTVIDNYGNAWHHFIGETFTGKPTDYFVSKYDEVITPHELLDLRSIGYEITSRGYGQAHGIAQRKDTR
jgi:hypothetical protein